MKKKKNPPRARTSAAIKNLSFESRFYEVKSRPLCQKKKYVLMSFCLKKEKTRKKLAQFKKTRYLCRKEL